MKEAIRLAIEGGWKPLGKTPYLNSQNEWVVMVDTSGSSASEWSVRQIQHFLLDPFFWQALGKALKWNAQDHSRQQYGVRQYWQHEWHRFIDHLAEGKDAESFFNELLK